MRHRVLPLVALCGTLLLLTACGPADDTSPVRQFTPEGNRLNVLVIVSDALRADVLGCYGGSVPTPNLDRLAASGVRFTQAHSTAPWTSPSSVSLLTGNYASIYLNDVTRVLKNRESFYVPERETTLPEHLAAVGYELVFNSHNPNSYISNNFQGFRKLTSDTTGTFDPPLTKAEYGELRAAVGLARRWEVHRRVAAFLNYLLHVPAEQPFFGVCWIDDPHSPYSPHGRFAEMVTYPARGLGRRRHYYANHRNLHLFDGFRNQKLTPREETLFFDLYKAEVASMDERVGFILDILAQRRLLDTTLVIFTSDHGEAFNEHGQFEHGRSYYEELVHVPLLMAGPDLPAGEVATAAVSHLDLMPTVRDLLEFDCPLDCQGESYRAELLGRGKAPRPLYFDSVTSLDRHDFRDAVYQEDYKLIAHHSGKNPELYDLVTDPGEQVNLALSDPQRVRRMLDLLARKRAANDRRRSDLGRSPSAEGPELDAREKAKILKKLKSLGYVN